MKTIVFALVSVMTCSCVLRADSVVGQAAWWNQSTPPQGGLPVPPLDALVTSAGMFMTNAELTWIRSHDPVDSVELIVGDAMLSDHQYADQWVYMATSECLAWNENATGCLDSRTVLGMTAQVHYDVVAWTEAADRTSPNRQMAIVAVAWAFHPADVNMDSVLDCADLDWFSSDPYDWNQDGVVTAGDVDGLTIVLTAAMADLDGNGVVDINDLLALLGSWTECSPAAQCTGDLDCNGTIGIEDLLILIGNFGAQGEIPALN